MARFCILLIWLFSATFLKAQDTGISLFTGGFILGRSYLSTSKVFYENNHWGIGIDFSYDDYSETWNDNSKSLYRLFALSGSGRIYQKHLGRGLFGEFSLGLSNAILKTQNQGTDKAIIPFTGLGIGWRFGFQPKGLFGEIGGRGNLALRSVHLYTTDIEPSATKENISYQSWLFNFGELSSQLYLGLGYSF